MFSRTVIPKHNSCDVRYDCSEHVFGLLDYCVHFLSRTPEMPAEKLAALQSLVADLGLNTHELDYQAGDQQGCW